MKGSPKRVLVGNVWVGKSKVRKGVRKYPRYQSETSTLRLDWNSMEELVRVNANFPLKQYLPPEKYEALKTQLETEGFSHEFTVARVVDEKVVHLPLDSANTVAHIQEALEAADPVYQLLLADATAQRHSGSGVRTISLESSASANSSESIEIVGVGAYSPLRETSAAQCQESVDDYSLADASSSSMTVATTPSASAVASNDWFKINGCDKGCKCPCVTILSLPSSKKKKKRSASKSKSKSASPRRKGKGKERGCDNGKDVFYYKVRWEGWPPVYDSWEPAAHIPEERRMRFRRDGYSLGGDGFGDAYFRTHYNDEMFPHIDGADNAAEKALYFYGLCKMTGILHDEASDQIQLNFLADFGCATGLYLREFAAMFRPSLAYALEPSRKRFDDMVAAFEKEKLQFENGEKEQNYDFGPPSKRVYHKTKKRERKKAKKRRQRVRMTGLNDDMSMNNLQHGADYEHMYDEKSCHLELECMDTTSYCHRELMKSTHEVLEKRMKAGEPFAVSENRDCFAAENGWNGKTMEQIVEEMPSLVFRIEAIKEKRNRRLLPRYQTPVLHTAVDSSSSALPLAVSSAMSFPSPLPSARKKRIVSLKKRSLADSLAEDNSEADTSNRTSLKQSTPKTPRKRQKMTETSSTAADNSISDMGLVMDSLAAEQRSTVKKTRAEMSDCDSSSSMISVSATSSISSASSVSPVASSARKCKSEETAASSSSLSSAKPIRRPKKRRLASIRAEIRERMERYKGWVPDFVGRLWHCEGEPRQQCACKHWSGFFNLGIFVSVGQYMDDESFDITMQTLAYYCEYLFFDVPTNYKDLEQHSDNGFTDQWAITTRSKDWYLAIITKYFRMVSLFVFESKYSFHKSKDSFVASPLFHIDSWPRPEQE